MQVMLSEDPDHPACLPEDVLLKQCAVTRLRRSGPGGQHRNKVETAVRIVHQPSGVSAEASERRSQKQNKAVAVRRLRIALALEVRVPLASDAPSQLWSSRCQGGRLNIARDHADRPCLLAEALDVLSHFGWDVSAAAGFLNCTASQLIKFLRSEPAAMTLVNHHRREHALRLLK